MTDTEIGMERRKFIGTAVAGAAISSFLPIARRAQAKSCAWECRTLRSD
jgi:hypothetical protein